MVKNYETLILYFDGASRNNPRGPAGCGWILYGVYGRGHSEVASGSEYLGFGVSNNQAEYTGLEEGLQYLIDNDIKCNGLYIRGDSELVIKQLDGEYQVRSSNLISCYDAVVEKLNWIEHNFVVYEHIDRSKNLKADNLANEAIDNALESDYSSTAEQAVIGTMVAHW